MKIIKVLLKLYGLMGCQLSIHAITFVRLCGIDERAKIFVSGMQILVLPLPLCPWAYDKDQTKDPLGSHC